MRAMKRALRHGACGLPLVLACAMPLIAQVRANDGPVVAPSGLLIQLAASRSQLGAGSTLGITATLTNLLRDSTIYLSESNIVLVQPPEITQVWWRQEGYFPAEQQYVTISKGTGKSNPGDTNGYHQIPFDSIVLQLRPGSSAQVLWVPPIDSTEWYGSMRPWRKEIGNQLRFLLFTPGEYRVLVQAKYWTSPDRPPTGYRLASQSMAVTVAAPQFVILLGAAIGGLVAFIIFPSRRKESVDEGDHRGEKHARKKETRWYHLAAGTGRLLVGALGAMLWSAIVTILLSRLSDTQFLVRVTVSDFWGAIAIGLVAQYAGARWFERLLSGLEAQKNKTATGGDDSAVPQKEPSDKHAPERPRAAPAEREQIRKPTLVGAGPREGFLDSEED